MARRTDQIGYIFLILYEHLCVFPLSVLCACATHVESENSCASTVSTNDPIPYPKYPLTLTDLTDTIIGGSNTSRKYYELYAFVTGPPRIVLNKVAIQWFTNSTGYFNNFAGWLQDATSGFGFCVPGDLQLFPALESKQVQFEFDTLFPTPERYIGTIFSSCPKRYHINWYCPRTKLVEVGSHLVCLADIRMNIYSAYGMNGLPWDLVVADLCKNKMPWIDDPRWVFTHDAPQQCTWPANKR
ncbi:uncharacterized protein LOC127869942 [Dreissena polymorpha]|uniref:uncharacterized protein LOC127869942 n=1 Tax=Dreissena polymorpha TaxID=45954 RepID=UPI00226427C3|nr:uncharacterized protein LOC127869942 [Dreissena polymorpha]